MGALEALKPGKSKEVTIIVNGREKSVPKGEITFNELIQLAFDDPPTGEFICFTVAYRKGPSPNQSGTLSDGEAIKVKKGMIFDVKYTDKA
ncbi:multiubiquitin domain-containing protein [Thalassospiraceae bacterium LMO-JJ14]|nr:multiubiquitin domain-containing protein [Thalassospiraceae bacterium LMO-JJ14]